MFKNRAKGKIYLITQISDYLKKSEISKKKN